MSDAERGALVVWLAVERLARKEDAAAIHAADARDGAQKRRLARTVRPQHSDGFAGGNRESDVVQHPHASIAGMKIFNREHGSTWSRDKPRPRAAYG
jgi:hypothetical protein